MSPTVRLYYPEPLSGVEVQPVFHYRHPVAQKGGGLFRDVQHTFFQEVETTDPAVADAMVLVNNFKKELSNEARDYIQHHADFAEKMGKPLFIFSCGDFTDTIVFDPRVWVFRYSLYRSSMQPRDISIPTSTEEPPAELISTKSKNKSPLVAFCGQGDYQTFKQQIKYHVKVWRWILISFVKPMARARIIGVYWRKQMMHTCEHSPLVKTNFIVRRSFSANAKSIELDPAQARREYLETTAHADFVLAPKGDGNYSNRFLKTLAFGRIPVLVDTDVVLPLEESIDYDSVIVRVPMEKVSETPEYIRAFYDALSEEEWRRRQEMARDIFQNYLKQDSFFRYFFTKIAPTLP